MRVVTSKARTSKNCWLSRVQRFAHQQFEGALGGFEFVAEVLHLLDAFEQFAARFVVSGRRVRAL
jgi:hypothetical protein